MDIETMAEVVGQCLRGESGYVMSAVGFKITELDCGEVYILTPGGKHFRLLVETVSSEDIEAWGIDFDV